MQQICAPVRLPSRLAPLLSDAAAAPAKGVIICGAEACCCARCSLSVPLLDLRLWCRPPRSCGSGCACLQQIRAVSAVLRLQLLTADASGQHARHWRAAAHTSCS